MPEACILASTSDASARASGVRAHSSRRATALTRQGGLGRCHPVLVCYKSNRLTGTSTIKRSLVAGLWPRKRRSRSL
eukprot:7361024-Pyramimonas_sp.AAC.1